MQTVSDYFLDANDEDQNHLENPEDSYVVLDEDAKNDDELMEIEE